MADKPRILWIDDVYGKARNGRNKHRDTLCSRLGLQDITGDCLPRNEQEPKPLLVVDDREIDDIDPTENNKDEVVADVTFCRGQVEMSGEVRNDLDGTLEMARNGWEHPPHWSLLLLDMHFATGAIGVDGEPVGTDEDWEPERYFGLTILDSLCRDSELRDIPVVITSAMERDVIERRFTTQGVWAFVDKTDLNKAKLKELLDDYGLLSDDKIIGHSLPLLQCLREARRRGRIPNENVLILGESGTGKELLAEYIHQQAGKAGKYVPFFPQGVPETLIEDRLFGHQKGAFNGATTDQPGAAELADAGTLFIDEFGDIPATVQAKLLRLLDKNIRETQRLGEQKAKQLRNLQVIMATEREEILLEDNFRKALLARAQVHNSIRIPTLNERSEDIPLLVEYFVKKYEQEFSAESRKVSVEALEVLRTYPWPGNIRELENVIENAVFTYKGLRWLEADHLKLPSHETQRQPIPLDQSSSQIDSDNNIPDSQPQMTETGIHENLDALIKYLNNFNFDGYQHTDLSGKLPQVESAYARFIACYLKAALNLRGEIQYQAAMRCITGDSDLSGAKAKRQIEKILWLSKTPYLISNDPEIIEHLRKFVESDPVLKKACDRILGRNHEQQEQ
ncbi:MAG: sigma 54-interacting transcriptional regulator [Candidatus Poribacteria bacterium]|nr:sigma 54-interacting transcriptional regulator [Candidatus Poribacteria bacterium]